MTYKNASLSVDGRAGGAGVESLITKKIYLLEIVVLICCVPSLLLSYLTFHTTVELLCALAAVYSYSYIVRAKCEQSHFIVVFGTTLLCVALVDLLHLLSYKGMGVFLIDETNVATQLWVLGRYLLVAGLLIATSVEEKSNKCKRVLAAVLILTAVSVTAVFLGYFPDAYLIKTGLTSFKINSEYLIIGLLLLAILRLNKKQDLFSFTGHLFLLVAIGITVLSEQLFTLYDDVYSPINAIGHLLKLVAYLLILNFFILENKIQKNDAKNKT